MIGLRIFWALILAGMVGFSFRRAWRWEHGEPLPEYLLNLDEPKTKETVVWVNALFLPALLLALFVLFAAMDGMAGVKRFLFLSLDVMLVISIYFLLLMFLLPVLRKFFSARACATMWILPVFLFWQAHVLLENAAAPMFALYIPSNILIILFWVWGIGFAAVFAGRTISHVIFRRRVMSVSYPVHDPEVQALFEQKKKELEYYHPVALVISPAAAAPFSMGTGKRTRVTVLPEREFTRQELQFIFLHEIHHLQRGDVSTKIFFAFCQALCWFNPLIWVATRKASDDLELSCDEIVLENMDEGMRKQYAELLLDTAGQAGGFTTCLSAAAETMRYRLKHIVMVREHWTGTLLLSIAMFLCVMSYGTIAVSTDRGTVAELIMGDRTAADITYVSYRLADSDYFVEEIQTWDGEGLFSYLTSLEAEKLGSPNQYPDIGGQELHLSINHDGLWYVSLYDRMIEVCWIRDDISMEYFYLRSDVDWGLIESYLN